MTDEVTPTREQCVAWLYKVNAITPFPEDVLEAILSHLRTQRVEAWKPTDGTMHPEAVASMYDPVQHRLNGGPYCYHIDDSGKYCGRAERWEGHGKPGFHEFRVTPTRVEAGDGDLVEALREADTVIEDWTEILRDGGFKSSIIDGDAARKRIADALSSRPSEAVDGARPANRPPHLPWKARGTSVYFANVAGGFDVRGCPDPVRLAEYIVEACNANTAAPSRRLTGAELPRGVATAIKAAERIRAKAAAGKGLKPPELHIIDLDDYAHTLRSELERTTVAQQPREAGLKEQLRKLEFLLDRRCGDGLCTEETDLLCKEIRCALRALASEDGAAVGAWQPIETAPKDGTDITICYQHCDTWFYLTAFWMEGEGVDTDDIGWWSYPLSELSRTKLDGPFELTHWQPRIAPPSPPEGGRTHGSFRSAEEAAMGRAPLEKGDGMG